ncbi:MAG TPA: HDIG domain-containing protein [Myxococcales bacterium]|nr:HDIG domain-containing protein [Myxococcales bacterium]
MDTSSLQQAFRAAGKPLFLVGGAVRDQLRGVPHKDIDFATEATPPQTKDILKKGGFPVIPIGEAFGTIATLLPDEGGERRQVEITTFRTAESYRKGSRHPAVTFGKSIEQDLARRDFTINAMAFDDRGTLIDPYGGVSHLKERLLETPSPAVEIFGEDPLRMLRAARFVSQLGFAPSPQVRAAVLERAADILTVSRERWKQELDKLLVGEAAGAALAFTAQTRLLSFLLPEMHAMLLLTGKPQGRYHSKDIWEHTIKVVEGAPRRAPVRWSALLHDVAKPQTRTEDGGEVHFLHHAELGAEMFDGIAERWRFGREERRRIRFLIAAHLRPNLYQKSWSDSAVRRLAEDAGDYLQDLLDLSRADITSSNPNRVAAALRNVNELAGRIEGLRQAAALVPKLPPGLGTLISAQLGVPLGPEIGRLRDSLLEAIREGALQSNQPPEVYLDYLKAKRAAAPKAG